MFFHSWESILRVALSAAIIYVVIVLALRVAGAPALAKMSGYDMIVTVALGSLVATIPLTAGLTVSDGFAAVVTFLVLQQITRWLQARSKHAHHVVRERPHLVVWDGELLQDRLLDISISADEVRAAVRRAGMLSVSQAQAVILENDGEWSVIPRTDTKDLSALEGLSIPYLLPPDADGRDWRHRDRGGGDGARAPTPSTANPV